MRGWSNVTYKKTIQARGERKAHAPKARGRQTPRVTSAHDLLAVLIRSDLTAARAEVVQKHPEVGNDNLTFRQGSSNERSASRLRAASGCNVERNRIWSNVRSEWIALRR